MHGYAKENAFFTALAGLVMLAYGWYSVALYGDLGPLHDASVTAFFLVLRYGGLIMIAAAAYQYTGQRLSLLVDAVVTGGCGLVLLLCGATWIALERSVADLNNILVPVVSLFLLRSGLASFAAYRGSGESVPPAGRRVAAQARPAAPPAPHPASLASSALPREDEPPPAEGYLAALAREKDEPPKASYE